MNFDNTTLITGGSGLVGSSLQGGKKPPRIEVDLLDEKSLNDYIARNHIKNVIHCAGRVGGIKANMENNASFFRENLLLGLNVFESCRKNNIEKLILFLSTCVFPAKVNYPLTYDQIFSGPPHSSNYGYAYAKRMLRILEKSYREQYGLKSISVIPCNIYGPHDNFNLNDGHVLPALIHKFYLATQNNSDIEIWGTGNEKREFLFAEDLHHIIYWIFNNYAEEEPLIISPNEVFIKDVVEIIKEEFDFKGNISYNGEMSGQLKKPSDSSRLNELFNPNYTPLEIGIKKTINWFMENYERARK